MRPSLCLSMVVAVSAASQSSSFVASQVSSQNYRLSSPPVKPFIATRQHHVPITQLSETVEKKRSEENLNNIDTDVNLSTSPHSSSSNRKTLAVAGITALGTVCLAAKTGILPGIPLEDGTFAHYTDAMIARDSGSTILALGLALVFVKFITSLAAKNILDPKDSRKIIHTLTGPLFIATWPLFSAAWGARFFASLVGVVNSIRLILAASGNEEEAELANAVSRSGDVKEAIGGPFLYVTTITVAILLFWRTSLTGIIAISTMAAGDGMADLVGRRFGKTSKWPFSKDKSIAGSIAFVVASTLTSTALAAWMSYTGCLTLPMSMTELVPRIAAISVLSAGVELIPFVDDNWTVPLSVAVLSILFLY